MSVKNLLYSSFLVVFPFIIKAQTTTSFVCNYYAGSVNEKAICNMLGYQTRQDAQKAVENIVRRSGLKQNFYVMECPSIDNCFAAIQNGERLIVYDAGFMRKVNNLTNTDWGAMSILAHEIGHHLQGHTLKASGSDPLRELEADEFSGFVMYQMGASLKDAQSAIWKMTTDYDTGSHPPRNKRMKAIKKGYDAAAELYPNLSVSPSSLPKPAENVVEDIEPVDKSDVIDINEGPIVINPKTKIPVDKPVDVVENTKKTGCLEGTCYNGYGVAVNHVSFEKYEGNWKNGQRTGFGKEFYADGKKKFEGDLINGKYNGRGTFYFANGDKYIGKFKNGIMNDESAILYRRNGDRLFVRYENGKKQGKGKIIYYGGVEATVYFKDDVEM